MVASIKARVIERLVNAIKIAGKSRRLVAKKMLL